MDSFCTKQGQKMKQLKNKSNKNKSKITLKKFASM